MIEDNDLGDVASKVQPSTAGTNQKVCIGSSEVCLIGKGDSQSTIPVNGASTTHIVFIDSRDQSCRTYHP